VVQALGSTQLKGECGTATGHVAYPDIGGAANYVPVNDLGTGVGTFVVTVGGGDAGGGDDGTGHDVSGCAHDAAQAIG